MRTSRSVLVMAALALSLASPAAATFHLMQIEQVIGGANGSTNIQAVQLRMRAAFQNLTSNARLVAYDAAGANPVVLLTIPLDVTNAALGDRVLIATADFASVTTPTVTPDFVFTNPIPASYLPAGSLTYETDFGTVLWRLSWGGSAYTGSGAGALTNDADGNFNPPWPNALPSTTTQALLFQNSASALSTNNAADYAVTAGAATFTNNARVSGSLISGAAVTDGGGPGRLALSPPLPNPVRGTMTYGVTLARDSRVQIRVLDLAGRVVGGLTDQALTAGQHQFTWNAGGAALSSGVYFLEMDAGGMKATQRFVLLR